MKFILVGGVIALMLVFVWFFSSGDAPESKQDRPYSSVDWSKRFQPFDKDPFGLYLFNTLAHTHINKKNNVYQARDGRDLDSLLGVRRKKKTFVFVGNFFGMKNSEMDNIVESIEGGSDLFLCYNLATENIMPNFFTKYEEKYEYNTRVSVFTNKLKCEMLSLYQNDTIACDWNAFGDVETKGPSQALSSFMELNNFIEIKMGEGRVLLHTNPAMFYNYQIKRSSGFKYTEYVLNQLAKDQDIILLELGRMSDKYGSHQGDKDEDKNDNDNSYLRILLNNPTLLTAMLLSILGMILFVSFRSKRKRPIVPYKQDKKDMTLAFAETITSIYFSKRNPYGLLQVQRKNFYAAIHRHFFVDLSRRNEDREITILAEKSNKPVEEIRSLLNRMETKEASRVTEAQVSEIAKIQRAFYKDVGIIPEKTQERVEEREITFKRGLFLPVLMILFGITAIFVGLYFLVTQRGVGIVLWPVGISLLFLGVARLANPYMRVSSKSITYYSTLGSKKVFMNTELVGTELKESGVILRFTHDRSLIINYWDLSRFDREQFNRFISKLHTLEL